MIIKEVTTYRKILFGIIVLWDFPFEIQFFFGFYKVRLYFGLNFYRSISLDKTLVLGRIKLVVL